MSDHKKERGGNPVSAILGFSLRGERHKARLWEELLPSARKKFVESGLFTPAGEITEKGRKALASLNKRLSDV